MTAALTIKRGADATTREEYDENDPAAVARMREKFDVVAPYALTYKTVEGQSTQIRRGEFPGVGEQAEVVLLGGGDAVEPGCGVPQLAELRLLARAGGRGAGHQGEPECDDDE